MKSNWVNLEDLDVELCLSYDKRDGSFDEKEVLKIIQEKIDRQMERDAETLSETKMPLRWEMEWER
jgi:hypothetical protein